MGGLFQKEMPLDHFVTSGPFLFEQLMELGMAFDGKFTSFDFPIKTLGLSLLEGKSKKQSFPRVKGTHEEGSPQTAGRANH